MLEDQPVSAAPEQCEVRADVGNFLMLVCDGISESDFPNREVVKLAADLLRAGGDKPDVGAASAAVCRQALKQGSKDNLSCMIVLLGSGGELEGARMEFQSGHILGIANANFQKAYSAFAAHAGLDMNAAVELRYDDVTREEAEALLGDGGLPTELAEELRLFGGGPPAALAVGSTERRQWFADWLKTVGESGGGPSDGNPSREYLMQMLQENPGLAQMYERSFAGQQSQSGQGDENGIDKYVVVSCVEELRPAIDLIPALKWDDRLESVCGQRGKIMKEDDCDGTAQVMFSAPISITAWLPSDVLTKSDGIRQVRVCEVDKLREAVSANKALKWDEKHEQVCGNLGWVQQEDDDIVEVQFEDLGLKVKLPREATSAA